MKTLKSAVLKISSVLSLSMFVVLLGTVEVNSYRFLFLWIAITGLLGLLACWLTDKNIILSRLICIVCVLKVFKAEHSKKLTAEELVLLRRKNSFGNYPQFYVDCMERYYA